MLLLVDCGSSGHDDAAACGTSGYDYVARVSLVILLFVLCALVTLLFVLCDHQRLLLHLDRRG